VLGANEELLRSVRKVVGAVGEEEEALGGDSSLAVENGGAVGVIRVGEVGDGGHEEGRGQRPVGVEARPREVEVVSEGTFEKVVGVEGLDNVEEVAVEVGPKVPVRGL
jgi:hypothetical protein